MKVVAVRVSSEHTVGGLLNPGDKVDVIGIFKQREPRSNRTTTISKTFLKALQVFNINNKTNAVDRGESTGRGGNTIVGLLVTEKQSEALVFAQGTGTIKLVLRGDEVEGDDEEIEDFDKIMAGKFGESETPLQTTAKAISPTHTMVIFKGDQSESQKFGIDGSPERKPVADMVRKERRAPDAGMSKDNGSAKESGNSDNDRNIDDDQYRGE
jgi:pilus assembly protein CpaB